MVLILEEDTIQREPQTISVVPDVKPSVSLDNTGLTKAQRQHKGAVEQLFKEGKKTLLLLEALRLCTSEQKEILEKYLGDDKIKPDKVDQVRNVFRDSGALESTRVKMVQLLGEGQKALDIATPPFNETYKQFLLDMSNFLVKRDY